MNEEKQVLKTEMNFPSNSIKEKEKKEVEVKKEETKKVEKVVTGKVIQKKKTLGKRFMETFVGEDLKNIKGYIFQDVLIPAAKDTISDIVQGITDTIMGSVDVALFGETRRRGASRSSRDRGKSYVSYDRMSSSSRDRDRNRDRDIKDINSRDRARHKFDDIILETRGEAEEVLGNLVDLIVDYEEATVADLYGFVGISDTPVDRNWGWKDLSSASVSRTRDGYMLNLPKTIYLN
jgi:hypothetical protein